MNPQPQNSQEHQAVLQFNDSAACARWLESLPLTNVRETQQALTRQLSLLPLARLPALEHLNILETLKEAAAFVEGEAAKRYTGKALPLEPGEMSEWTNVIKLWAELGRNYQQCLQAYRDGDLAVAPHAALVCLRCLSCLGNAMLDHYRTYRQIPGMMWRELHELYSFAEQHGLARIRVEDCFARNVRDSSCAERYMQSLLAHLACPFSLSARQLDFTQRWLEKWATLASLSTQPLPPNQITSLAVDLAGNAGATFAAELEPGFTLRYLELEQLSKMLRQTINMLKQGQTPGQLGLGEDARQPGCENLLMLLYVQWCRAGTARMEERRTAEEAVKVCFGIPAVHRHLSGRVFRQPGELSSRDKLDLDTFGFIARVKHEAGGAEESAPLETWQIVNHSASGFLCMLREANDRTRLSHNQLLGVRRDGSGSLHLGIVQWLKTEESGELCCGVRLFPGTPQAVAVRPSNIGATGSDRYERALLLPEVAAPAVPATLVLPGGWFQSGRFVEMIADRKHVVKLLNLLERCGEFDRCTITIV